MAYDTYIILNYLLIDPESMDSTWFKQSYLIFNCAEAAIWFGIAMFLPFRFRIDKALVFQATALIAFGFSDLIECQGTTLLLLLYKGALLLALVQGGNLLAKRRALGVETQKSASPA